MLQKYTDCIKPLIERDVTALEHRADRYDKPPEAIAALVRTVELTTRCQAIMTFADPLRSAGKQVVHANVSPPRTLCVYPYLQGCGTTP